MASRFIISAAVCSVGVVGSVGCLKLYNKPADVPPKRLLIIGSGSAGLAIAHQFKGKISSGDAHPCEVTVVDPSTVHYYQPLWTLVGASLADRADSVRPMAPLMPSDVVHITGSATSFDPGSNTVSLSDGSQLSYDYLVVATGLRTRWDLVPGLQEALNDPACPVVSIYDYNTCQKTSKFISEFKSGTAIFTQPPQPFKCAGAPQKIMYDAAIASQATLITF